MQKIKLLTEDDINKNKNDLEELFKNLNILDMTEMIKKLTLFVTEKMCICLGAYEKNELVGILWAYKREFSGELRYHINYFSIKNKSQNQGIGKKLLEKLKDIAKEKKVRIIDLNVDIDNEQAKNFYKKNNFEEEKILLYLNLGEK